MVSTGPPNNLPVQLTSFIGRDREIAEVTRLLRTARLLTLTGAGGSGKTRLSLQVASDLLGEFEHGIFFVSLAAISDHNLVVSTIARTLGLPETPGQSLLDSLKDHLREKQILLILDNFEHIIDSAPAVVDLLGNAPDLKVLVTSRVPVRIRGEKEFPVLPLQLPDYHDMPPLEHLTRYEAVRLFTERASDVRPDFQVVDDNASAIAEICVRLDGLPLAIELAATRMRLFSARTLLSQLSNRLKVLTGGARDLPARQQTLRNTIEWSYDLLDEGTRQFFRRIAVFNGGCTLQALQSVCNYDGQLQVDVLNGVESLVSKSLLQQRESLGGEPRFWVLETLHEYAREKLSESKEDEALEKEHALYFMNWAEAAEPHLRDAEQQIWLDMIGEEYDNIVAALLWAKKGAESGQPEKAEVGLRTVGAISHFWQVRGYYSEGREQVEGLFSAAALLGCSRESIARALMASGALAWRQGDYTAARTILEQALAISREAGAKKTMARSLVHQGIVASIQGDYVAARSLYEEGLTLMRELDDKGGIASSLGNLGIVAYMQEDYGAAGSLIDESLSLMRELDDKRGIAFSLANRGNVAYMQMDYPTASSLYKESLSIKQELGDKWGMAVSLAALGGVSTVMKDIEQTLRGVRLMGASEALFENIGAALEPDDRIPYDRGIASARAQLGESVFNETWQEGRSMSIEQATAYAFEHILQFERTPQTTAPSSYPNELSKREVEVLILLTEGLTNDEMAARLFLSTNTVRAHLHSIFGKLDVSTRGAAARFAIENKLQ